MSRHVCEAGASLSVYNTLFFALSNGPGRTPCSGEDQRNVLVFEKVFLVSFVGVSGDDIDRACSRFRFQLDRCSDHSWFRASPCSTFVSRVIQNFVVFVYWNSFSGYDGFRVRVTYYRPPTNFEASFLLDPPLEGPEDGRPHGLSFDTSSFGINQTAAIKNGNMLFRAAEFKTGQTGLNFYRIEPNGTETLVMSEYAPSKCVH